MGLLAVALATWGGWTTKKCQGLSCQDPLCVQSMMKGLNGRLSYKLHMTTAGGDIIPKGTTGHGSMRIVNVRYKKAYEKITRILSHNADVTTQAIATKNIPTSLQPGHQNLSKASSALAYVNAAVILGAGTAMYCAPDAAENKGAFGLILVAIVLLTISLGSCTARYVSKVNDDKSNDPTQCMYKARVGQGQWYYVAVAVSVAILAKRALMTESYVGVMAKQIG